MISAIGKCVIKGWRDDTDYFLVTTTKSRKVTATVSLKECQFSNISLGGRTSVLIILSIDGAPQSSVPMYLDDPVIRMLITIKVDGI